MGTASEPNKCGPGQPPEPHLRDFLRFPYPREAAEGPPEPNRARRNAERRLCRSQLPIRHPSITSHQPSQWPAILSCSEEQGGGRRPQRPGNPVRGWARFLDFPRQFTLENHRLPLTLPQSFASSGNFTFRWTHSPPETLPLATQKLRHLVKKLWRMRLPCG